MLRFIHLSDIHFNRRTAGYGFDPDQELRNRVIDDIAKMRERFGPANGVLVSGDIAFAGKAPEYENAAAWLDRVCDAAGCGREEVLLCPGNHDIDRDALKNNVLIQDGHEVIRRGKSFHDCEHALETRLTQEDARALFYKSLEAYNNFAARYESSFFADEKSFVRERDYPLNDGSTLRIRSLNSALLSGLSDQKGSLFLGLRAVTLAKQAGVEYLTMSHHPPNWLMDGNEAEKALDGNARIQLFGHEHDSRVRPGRDWLKLYAGAITPHRGESNWRPGYNIIELQVENEHARVLHVKIHAREWQGDPPQFRMIEDRNNSPVFDIRIHLDSLPEGWRSPHVDETVKATGVEIEAVRSLEESRAETPVATRRLDFRMIIYRFFRRTLSDKNSIIGALKLAEDDDSRLVDFERFKLQLARARERGLLSELEALLAKLEGAHE